MFPLTCFRGAFVADDWSVVHTLLLLGEFFLHSLSFPRGMDNFRDWQLWRRPKKSYRFVFSFPFILDGCWIEPSDNGVLFVFHLNQDSVDLWEIAWDEIIVDLSLFNKIVRKEKDSDRQEQWAIVSDTLNEWSVQCWGHYVDILLGLSWMDGSAWTWESHFDVQKEFFKDVEKRFLLGFTQYSNIFKRNKTPILHSSVYIIKLILHTFNQCPCPWQNNVLFLKSLVETTDLFEDVKGEQKMGVDERVWEDSSDWDRDTGKPTKSVSWWNELFVLYQELLYFFHLAQKRLQDVSVEAPSGFWWFRDFPEPLVWIIFSQKLLVCDGFSFLWNPITE